MNKNSLNKKWYVPQAEEFEQEGFASFKVLKHVLIHMKDKFEQLPGGKIDLNTVTMKINNASYTSRDIVDDLYDVVIFFDERVDEDSGNTIMFFDVKDFKELPDGASTVTTEDIGIYSEFLVKTYDGDIEYKSDCEPLCPESSSEDGWAREDQVIWSDYSDGYILKEEASYVDSCGSHFATESRPDSVHWSDWNEAYVDENDDYVHYGYTGSSSSDEYFFYHDEAVWCDDTDSWYADNEVAESHNVYYRNGEWREGRGREGLNADYQSQERVFRFNAGTNFGIGFEIEKEDYEAIEIPWGKLYDNTGWAKESDSSLCDESGYELVSPAFDLFDDRLDKDIEESSSLKELIEAQFSTNCGGHLTFSSSDYTANELLEGVAGFIPLMYALYNGRLGNHYCEPKQKWVYHRGSGRDAVNIRGNRIAPKTNGKVFGAIEFRLFSAVRNVKNLMWRRDLMRIIAKNINKSEKEVLRMLCSPKSLLFKHLIKVYSADKIIEKIRLFVEYSKQYNFRKLDMPDTDALKNVFNKSNNKNSTNELGA